MKYIPVSVTIHARPYFGTTGKEIIVNIEHTQRIDKLLYRLEDKIEEAVWEVLGEEIIP